MLDGGALGGVNPGGGPGAGSIDSTGLYTAPDFSAGLDGHTDVVVATLVEDPLRKAFAWVTLVGRGPWPVPVPTIQVTPKLANLYYPSGHDNEYIDPSNTWQLFRARIRDSDETQVDWRVDGALQSGHARHVPLPRDRLGRDKGGHDRGADPGRDGRRRREGHADQLRLAGTPLVAKGGEAMGDVDVKQVKNIDPIRIREVTGVEPIRVSKIAPAAIHVKELNQIDPITVESLRVDEVRNLDPVKIDHFDVTHLPTVNLSLGEVPELALDVRRFPSLAVGLHQNFVLPSEYTIRARVLGFELARLHVTGRTMLHPHDEPRGRWPRATSGATARSPPSGTRPSRGMPRGGRGDDRARAASPPAQAPARSCRAACRGRAPVGFSLAHREPAAVESAVSAG